MQNSLGLSRLNINEAALKRIFTNLILIFTGAFLSAFSINSFIIPNHLLTGGVSGLAIILNYLLHTPVSVMILLLNVPIFWWGYREINRRFFLYSIAGTFALSLFLGVTRNLIEIPKIDLILAAVFGGAINGAGFGLIFKAHGSTGGTDIVAVVLRKKKNLGLGEVSFYSNLLIIIASLFFFQVSTGLYTIISMFVGSKVVDAVITGLNTNKSVMIISDYSRQIGDWVNGELHRGVTYFSGQGAYSKTQKSVVNCVINRFELARLKEFVAKQDPEAFMYISDANEVMGKGFPRQ